MTRPNINATEFDEIAQHCGRWAETSLAISRALIVDNVPLADVAEQFDCSAAYANTVRARFYTKARAVRVAAFKQQVRPDELAALRPYAQDISQLAQDGFTPDQLVEYLKQHSVTATADTVMKYLGTES